MPMLLDDDPRRCRDD